MSHGGADQPHDDLTVKIWETVGEAVQRLEGSWAAGAPSNLAELAPEPGHPLRRRTLIELVKVDQELRWQAGEHRLLESYLSDWPELSSDPELVTELLDAECLTRAGLDRLPTPDELAARFPEMARQIDLGEIARRANDEVNESRKWRFLERNGTSASDRTSSAVHEPPTLEIGQQFGRYAVRSLLGRGGMGCVYHAYDTLLQRDVALKIPRFAQSTDHAVVERFLRESRAAARIEHPHVCAVYDAGDVNGVHYLTMRRVRGQSLAQRLQQGPLKPVEAARLTHKLALALSAIHDHGMLHRDIKTSNILLDEVGEPLLTDFGLARLPDAVPLASDQPVTSGSGTLQSAIDTDPESNTAPVIEPAPSAPCTTPLMGTIHYLAPELFQNQPADVRSDIYSLGVVFYRMLAGCLPFPGQRGEVADAIQHHTPRPPSHLQSAIPRELETICLKAMARQPANRYQSAAEMADALHQWLQAKPKHNRPLRKYSRIALTLAAVISVVVVGTLAYLQMTAPPIQVPIGWGLPRCDLEGTRFYPVPTKVRLERLSFTEVRSISGGVALTGDIDGNGVLELVVGHGTKLRAYRFAGIATSRWESELLWELPDAGHLDLVTNVAGNAAEEIVTSGTAGDRLFLRVYNGRRQLLRELSTGGEIAKVRAGHDPKASIHAFAVADLQQDGDREIIAAKQMEGGTHSRGIVVFDFPTGKELYYRNIGPMVTDVAVGQILDMDIVHATNAPDNKVRGEDGSVDNRCYVYCFYGRTGRHVWKEPRCFEGKGFVRSYVSLSDLDGDGTLEIVAASMQFLSEEEDGSDGYWNSDLGRVYLLDPTTGNTRPKYHRNFDIGVQLCGIADFNGDHTKDILVKTSDVKVPGDSIMILSGTMGLPDLHTFVLPGHVIAPCSINDINGDGQPEIVAIAGVPGELPRRSTLYVLGSSLSEVWRWQPDRALNAAIVSDLNGDGVNEIIVSGPSETWILAAASSQE